MALFEWEGPRLITFKWNVENKCYETNMKFLPVVDIAFTCNDQIRSWFLLNKTAIQLHFYFTQSRSMGIFL